ISQVFLPPAHLLEAFSQAFCGDRIGRRPILLMTQLSTLICGLLFGFSTSYRMAMFARFLDGFFSSIGVAKTSLSEITNDTNQAKGGSPSSVLDLTDDHKLELRVGVDCKKQLDFEKEALLTGKPEGVNTTLRDELFRVDTVCSVLIYDLLGLVYVAYDELFPLWSLSRWDLGGLNLGSNEVGLAQTAGGVSLIPFQLFVYPILNQRLGPTRTLQLGLIFGATLGALPLVRIVGTDRSRLLIAIMSVQMLRSRLLVPARDCIFYGNLTLPIFEQHLASQQDPATLFHGARSFANADVELAANEEPDSDGAREAALDPPVPVTSSGIPEFIPLADAAPKDVRDVHHTYLVDEQRQPMPVVSDSSIRVNPDEIGGGKWRPK
ncbi:unnamed protein product, partial [Closterium sp. NIES-53]